MASQAGVFMTKGGVQNERIFRSYVSRVLFATLPPTCAADAVARRWRWLRASVYDPYRPELHYMRGPGPKWRAKHGRSAG